MDMNIKQTRDKNVVLMIHENASLECFFVFDDRLPFLKA